MKVLFRDREHASASAFLPSIQGLRGIAALSVLVAHLYDMPKGGVYDQPAPGFLPPFPEWLQAALNTGGHGVELFFMISGFLIPASLVRHGAVGRFMFDRIMRIMPVFVILHVTVFAFGPVVGYKFFRGLDLGSYLQIFLANLLFVQDLVGLPIAQQNAWTLTYEWAFYIWFAATFLAVREARPLASGTLVLLGLACVGYRPNAAFFAIGMVFSTTDLRIAFRGAAGTALGILCFAGMYAALDLSRPWLALAPGALLFAMALTPRSAVGAALCAAPLQYLGKISYSLYLVHPFALYPLQILGLKLVERGGNRWLLWAGFAGAGVTVAFAASAASYELVEVRLRRVIDHVLRGLLFRPMRSEKPA